MKQKVNYEVQSDKALLKMILKESCLLGVVDHLLEEKTLPEVVFDMTVEEMMLIDGVGIVKANQLLAFQEIVKRLMNAQIKSKTKVSSPVDVYNYAVDMIYLQVEEFRVLLLNTKNEILKEVMISRGSLNASIVHPREVMRSAIKVSAASMILLHNHPSGYPSPSTEDKILTKRLVEAGQLIGIAVVDHLIVGKQGYYSFKEDQAL